MASSSFHLHVSHHTKAIPKITFFHSTKRPTLPCYPTTTTTTFSSSSSSLKSTIIKKNKAHTFNVCALSSNNGVKPLEPSSEVCETPLKIAIIGFGNFGQFIAKGIQRQGHVVLAFSRSDYSQYCNQNGIRFFETLEGLCHEEPDIVLVCSSILSTESVMLGIPFHKLKPDTIFADVLSVKQFPRNLFLEVLPTEFGIVCTHPMFGPESGRHGWAGLPFVYDEVRILKGSTQAQKCAQFLSIFQNEGCRMVEMSCEEHDRHAAGTQFITHTIGRILSQLNLESTPINTKGYETLLQLTENTVSDSFDLYYGLFMYNVNATAQMDNLDKAFEIVKQKLFGRLHGILRKQIVERIPLQRTQRSIPEGKPSSYFLPDNKKMNGFSSFAIPPEPAEKLSTEEQDDEKDKATVSSRFPF